MKRAKKPTRCPYGTDNLELRGGPALSPTGVNAATVTRPQSRAEFLAFFVTHSAGYVVTDHGGIALVERSSARALADYYFGAAVAS